MRVAAVESATLATVSYDDARELLQLEFGRRAVYQYFSVPASVHQSLLDASSKGRYFNEAIRGHFRGDQFRGQPQSRRLKHRPDLADQPGFLERAQAREHFIFTQTDLFAQGAIGTRDEWKGALNRSEQFGDGQVLALRHVSGPLGCRV